MYNFLVSLFLLLPCCAFAVQGYKNGDELNVLAQSGLKLRAEPNSDKTLATIPFGATVTVSEEPSHDAPFESNGIKGFWLKVKYKDKIGYVFDGLLSWLPAPDKSCKSLEDYANKNFKASTPKFVTNGYGCANDEQLSLSFTTSRFFQYRNITLVFTEVTEHEGWLTSLTFSGGPFISLEEAWLIANIIYTDDFKNCQERIQNDPDLKSAYDGKPYNIDDYRQFNIPSGKNFFHYDMIPDGCTDEVFIGADPANNALSITRGGGC